MENKYIKPTNTITIVGEMITDMGLKGNELLIYAIISGFSQDGASAFIGSISYFQEFTSLSRQAVINILKNLIQKGLIEKEQEISNGITINAYRVVKKLDYLSKNLTTCKENRLLLEKRENEEKKVTQRKVVKESKDLKEDKEIKEIYSKEKKENEERGNGLFDETINTEKNTPPTPISAPPLPPIDEVKKKSTFEEREKRFVERVQAYSNRYTQSMLDAFIRCWTEPNASNTKMRFEMQQTFEIGRRLATWASKEYNNRGNFNKPQSSAPATAKKKTKWEEMGMTEEEYNKIIKGQL